MKSAWMLLALLVPAASFAASDLAQVQACMKANSPPSVRIQNIELSTTDRSGGSRTIKGKLIAKKENTSGGERVRTLLKVNEPAAYAGSSYLVIEADNYLQDGMYVYLPAVGRARRVSGTAADGALLGTNFSYNDFRQLQTAFVDSKSLLEDPETWTPQGQPPRQAYVLSFTPSADAQSRYSMIRMWVDQETCVPVKVELREGLNQVKELTVPVTGLAKSNNRWYASEARMRDLVDGTQSVLKITGTALGANVPNSNFDPATFYIGQ